MSNVLIDREKIDILANAISDKSGVPVTMTLDEMVEAVDGIETGGGEPNLQAKTYTVDSAGTATVTADSGYDGLSGVAVSVPSGNPDIFWSDRGFYTESNQRKWRVRPLCDFPDGEGHGWMGQSVTGDYLVCSAVAKNTSVTPTESAQTIGGANYMMEGAVTVNAIPSNYVGSGITQRSSSDLTASGATVTVPSGYYSAQASKAVASGTAGTPTATKGTVSNHAISVTPSVTNTSGYITGSTKTGTAVSVSASELVSGTYTVDSSGTKDVTNYASASVPAGTAGTPSASKGTVSNHSVSVTPSVTNTTGWITGSTKTGTAVTVTASELASGNKAITQNGTNIDVVGYSTVSVNVQGGGGGISVGTASTTATSNSSLTFTGLAGEPSSLVIISTDEIATQSIMHVATIAFDGDAFFGQGITNTSNAQVTALTNGPFMPSYNNGTLTIGLSGVEAIIGNDYNLIYTYNGSDIRTSDVQVGSGATSITFTGIEEEPSYFSCIFKSNFSTSSGYQRAIAVVYDGTDIYGLEMDSSAKPSDAHWSYTYNNGSLTITSQGTNSGGYFHQPGYYQLTYAYDGSGGNYQSKTVTPTTIQQVVQADSGYDALSRVTVTAVSQTNLTAANIKSGTTVTISNGTSNIYSVTGTYSGGGSSKNVQVLQSTSRTNSSSLTKVLGDLTVSKTGTYDIYWSGGRTNTSTSYTWGTRLYVDGTGYDTENTTWSNNCQSNHLSNVSLTVNQKLSVYARGRTGSYYTFAPMLVIIEA